MGKNQSRRPVLPTICLLGSVLFASAVQAVTISPVMLELSPQKRVASVQVHNDSDQAMTFQTDTLAWEQVDGEDRYLETQELLVAPSMSEIAPGASQIFRVTLRKAAASESERAYRLLLEDVTAETAVLPGTVAFRFRHNLPLFASPPGTVRPDARWSRCAAPAGKACVRLDNAGNRHVRLNTLKVEGQDWSQEIKGGGTVLAGAWRQWLFDTGAVQRLPLRVVTGAGNGEATQTAELAGPTP